MKFGTDLTSLAAIGLGTMVALGASGAMVASAVGHHYDSSSSCITVRSLAPEVAAISEVARADAMAALADVEVVMADLDAELADLKSELADVAETDASFEFSFGDKGALHLQVSGEAAPGAVARADARIVIAPEVEVRSECFDPAVDVRVDVDGLKDRIRADVDRARELADEARADAERARLESGEIREMAERIREQARSGQEIEAAEIQALVSEALREAGLQRDADRGGN